MPDAEALLHIADQRLFGRHRRGHTPRPRRQVGHVNGCPGGREMTPPGQGMLLAMYGPRNWVIGSGIFCHA